eukprot:jgi/Botrbrau1/5285/Bobra.0391s0006.1
MVHRPFIRKAINNVFYRFVFETERHNGIAELLEILGSIINGFALPLKEEHKLFLQRALMPLHKPKCVGMYSSAAAYCVTQFVGEGSKVGRTSGELEEIVELTQAQEFAKVMEPLFKQIAKCLNSSHFQVAERSLFLWNNEYIVSMVAQQRQTILPLVFAALEQNARSHWNPAVHGLTCNVRKMFQDMDEQLWESCRQQYQAEEGRKEANKEERKQQWARLEAAAEKGHQATATKGGPPTVVVR